MKSIRRNPLVAVALFLFAAMVIGCGMEELYSTWCDRRVATDGIDAGGEWEGALHLLSEEEITVGLLNDEKMFYLRLSTRNPAIQRQILTAGLTVWFDETGGKRQTFGVHYPLPTRSRGADFERRPPSGKEGVNPMEPPEGMDPLREISLGNIEISRAGTNEHSTLSADHPSLNGVRCRIANTRGTLVYELRVPLIRNAATPHGIAVSKTKTIGIGLMTAQVEQPRKSPGDWGGGRGGGRGSGGGGPPGGMGGGMGQPPQGPPGGMGGSQEETKPISHWLKVHLAERP